ncbi:MAG: hypothetical protein EOP92_17190 [Lysobacteraceae bacterium]|nr:MAG: hypothetical protein EOP92_17190 [Xanthomonadaceae bacterium]
MKNRLGALAFVALLAGCSAQDDQPLLGAKSAASSSPAAMPTAVGDAGLAALARDKSRTLGNAPDKGELFSYADKKGVKQRGAYTLMPVQLSEEHALRGVATGLMKLPAPDGSEISIRYERHEEGEDGNWSWIGRVVGGDVAQEAIITFGEHAVFGSIPQAVGPALRLTTENGIAYLVKADPSKLIKVHAAGGDTRVRSGTADVAMGADNALVGAVMAKAAAQAKTGVETKAFTSTTIIDLAIGYSNGFVTARGGASAAATRISNLVAISNQALANSNVNAQVRVVHAAQVNYADNTTNGSALEQITGSTGTAPVTIPAAFTALRAAREQFGADLVTFIRDFQSEQVGCGVAWLNGGNQTPIVPASDAAFGYSVVSDGDYDLNGNTYFCDDITLIHEMAHNMGSQHDVANNNGASGRYPYSYGYKTAAAQGNFYTVMAYGDDNQTLYRVFSSPEITTCGGIACGIANQADNARSLRQTTPIIAQFRATVVAVPAARPDLYAISKVGTTNTEVHALSASSSYKNFSKHLSTAFPKAGTSVAWTFLFGDYNGDGVADMYGFSKNHASGKTVLQVMNGVGNYKTALFNGPTILGNTGTDARWVFELGDYNYDGKLDIYAINRMGTSATEVHVLNAATGFQTYLLQTGTVLARSGTNNSWKFDLADANGDGILDLFAISKAGTTATEVHVMNGAGGFKTYLSNTSTILGKTGTDNLWDFKVGDYNGDRKIDVYAMKKQTPGGKTEVHVLNGANNYQGYLLNVATGLGVTGDNNAWEFALVK